jgi:hypothetical protein
LEIKEDQTAWDQLSPHDAEAIVLKPRPPHPSKPPAITVNLHGTSSRDYLTTEYHDMKIAAAAAAHNDGANGDNTDNMIMVHLTQRRSQPSLPPGHLQRMLSSSLSKKVPAKPLVPKTSKPGSVKTHEITIDGQTYRSCNMHEIDRTYHVSASRQRKHGALIDCGANVGISSVDMRVISTSIHHTVNVQGINNHQVTDVPIVSAGGVLQTQRGPIIGILHELAHIERGKTILSSDQLEWYGQEVNDRSTKIKGGTQCITTLEGYVIPISIWNGLPYINLHPYTDQEWEDLPHVILTSQSEWDPKVLDKKLTTTTMTIGLTPFPTFPTDPSTKCSMRMGSTRKALSSTISTSPLATWTSTMSSKSTSSLPTVSY